ncbi:arylsulfatase [Lewinella sp. JB7]|uniref:arylsulfatase n=1 Tax=Lewinella sp. JB7 TaxID=2962887 RepID=UPI0020C9AD95|nr:arylsulfatase [Lewinella sp. JB7]MCP9236686.1 arylsulfatase [Lewinella sp. JB7]
MNTCKSLLATATSSFTGIALLWILLGSSGCHSTSGGQDADGTDLTHTPPPNIVYILADDLGYGDLSCYGQTNFRTPTLDAMAAGGIRFTQHYAGSTVCAPSRASLMTGRHTGNSYVRGNYETGPRGFGAELPLRPDDLTLGEVLQGAGYRTAAIGKWGMGMDGTTGEPLKKGFDYSYGVLNQAYAHYQYPDSVYVNGAREAVPGNQDGQRGSFSGDLYTNQAVRFIESVEPDQPFFVYLAYTTPHAEMLVPEDSIFHRFAGQFPEQAFRKGRQGGGHSADYGPGFGAYASQDQPFAAYAAMVVRLDRDTRRIQQSLERLGLAENTLVLFSSDNGPHAEGGAVPEQFGSAGGLRGQKRDLYEGGIRVPFIAYWPGVIDQPAESDLISSFWDILPTVAELAGTELGDYATDGVSLAPTLRGDTGKQEQHEYLYWEFHERAHTTQAVRRGDWKAVRLNPAGPLELYHLPTDPSESNNVAEDHPEIVASMRQLMQDARSLHPLWPLKV